MAASPIVTIIGSGAVRAHPTRGGASFLVQHAGRNLLHYCKREQRFYYFRQRRSA
ncbi:MAG: hypothetical protein H3C27_06315 [Opitutaceae bacterium]|nr:hypothetical protein [Opitutaceae bacterium]